LQLFESKIEKAIELRKARNSNSHDRGLNSRRAPIDRRQYSYTKHLPDRRDKDRRKGTENRRNGKDRRSGIDRRNSSIILEKE
jgi:hypothetical protein